MKALKLCSIVLIAFAVVLQAQMRVEIKGDDVFNLPEVGAVIVEQEGQLSVAAVLPDDMKMAEYKNVDLRKDDVVIMVNGVKLTSCEQLRNIYKDTKSGEVIKFGVKRDGKPMLVSLKKADPARLPKMNIVTKGDWEGGSEDLEALAELGVIVAEKEGKMVVHSIFQTPDGEGSKDILEKGDVLLSINGKKVKNADEARGILSKVSKGEIITAGISRSGKPVELKVPKLEMKTRMMLSK